MASNTNLIISFIFIFFCTSFILVKSKPEEPGCLLPRNFTGFWMNTAHTEADVEINETHIIETAYPDEGRYRKTIYVCKEQKDSRYLMARLNIDGWWVELDESIIRSGGNLADKQPRCMKGWKALRRIKILKHEST